MGASVCAKMRMRVRGGASQYCVYVHMPYFTTLLPSYIFTVPSLPTSFLTSPLLCLYLSHYLLTVFSFLLSPFILTICLLCHLPPSTLSSLYISPSSLLPFLSHSQSLLSCNFSPPSTTRLTFCTPFIHHLFHSSTLFLPSSLSRKFFIKK